MAGTSTKRVTITTIILFISMACLPWGCDSSNEAGNQLPDRASAGQLQSQARRIIQQSLGGSDPAARANAIEAAAAANDRQLMSEVQRLLRDELVPVRFAAAVAIGDAQYAAARNDVAQLLKDDDENVRIAGGYAVYKLGSPGGLELIRRSITSRDLGARANAAFLLGKSGDRTAAALLYKAISDESSDDKVRLNAVEAIARLGDARIYQKIWAMLISAYGDDRVFGIRAMGALGTAQACDALLTMLKDDLVEVRLVAAEQLGALGRSDGESIIIEALEKGPTGASDQEERQRVNTLAALAIGQVGTPGLKRFLPDLLKNESVSVRLATAKAVLQYAGRGNIGR